MLWIINIFAISFLFFRILAIRISKILIKTGEFHEGNIVMKSLIKSSLLIILYNLFFISILIFCNYWIKIYYDDLSQFLFYGVLILFLVAFFDFIYDFIKYWKFNGVK